MTPKQMLDRWHTRLRERGYDVMMDGFVRRLNIKYEDKFEHTCWVPKNELFDFHVQVQEGFDDPVGPFINTPQSFHNPRPAVETAAELAATIDPDERAKMFIAAILREDSRGVVYGYEILKTLELREFNIWYPSARFTTPHYEKPQWFLDEWSNMKNLCSDEVILDYLADLTAVIMATNVVVTFVFGDEQDPVVAKKIEYKQELQRQRSAELDAKLKLINDREKLRASWDKLTNAELEQMIWSKPITEVAKVSGYSDVAIHKRCRQLGIKTPPRGFWAKVHAGAIPHPNGVAQL